MKMYDVTRVHQEAPIYPGSAPVKITELCSISKGDVYTASFVEAGVHMGTHADAYTHFIGDSEFSIDKMPLEHYYGKCRVITVPPDSMLGKADFEGKLDGAERLVIHGGGMSYLKLEAAEYIVSCNIKTILTDAWSISPLDNEAEIHRLVLGNKIAVVENLILDGVPDGDYLLSAFPVKYGNCDGAPVRAILIEM